MSGSGGGGGYEYQARATAYVAAHILAEENLRWIEDNDPDVPISVAGETGGAGDDLCITLRSGIKIELQAKHGLEKDKLWKPLIKLGKGLKTDPKLYGVILTDSTASKTIREDLRNDFKRLGQGRVDNLKAITKETQQKFLDADLPDIDPEFFKRLVIIVLDLDEGLQDGKQAQLLLSRILHDRNQSAIVWEALCSTGQSLNTHEGCRDSKDWARLLCSKGVQLAADCAKANGVMSLEEKEYLESVKQKYQDWWLDSYAFMNEINDANWQELELTVKIPKSKLNNETNSLSANDNGDKTAILPILDALRQVSSKRVLIVGKAGAGKSTILAKVLLEAAEEALQNSISPVPVLIKLKDYQNQSDFLLLIRDAFERFGFLEEMQQSEQIIYIKKLIKDKRLVLLADGVNELSSDGYKAFKYFCGDYLPMIATTRDINVGNLGIQTNLEIQPLSAEKVKGFFSEKLPDYYDNSRVQELCDRVRDFGQTPLMVWMLYIIFKQNPFKETPNTRGEAYREFTDIYSREAKDEVDWVDLCETRSQLSLLAFEMTRSESSFNEEDVLKLIGKEKIRKNLLSNHLLQRDGTAGSRKVQFCHPSLQEYYAAEYILAQMPELIEKKEGQKYTLFQIHYLNYLKWTEAIAIMLGFSEIDNLAEQVVQQALDVDLFLGARLSGVVKAEIHEKTVKLVENINTTDLVKITLLEKTESIQSATGFKALLSHQNEDIRRRATWALRKMPCDVIISLSKIVLQDLAPKVRENIVWALGNSNDDSVIPILDRVLQNDSSVDVRLKAVYALQKFVNEEAILSLLKATENPEPKIKRLAIYTLIKLDRLKVINTLSKALSSRDVSLKISVVKMLSELGGSEVIPLLNKARLDLDSCVHLESERSLKSVRDQIALQIQKNIESSPLNHAVIQEREAEQCISALKSNNPIQRGNAIGKLYTFLGRDSLSKVIEALSDTDSFVQFSACNILAAKLIRQFPEELEILSKAIPKLIRIIEDADSSNKAHAASALGQLGDKKACPSLLQAMRCEDADTRRNVLEALIKLGCQEVKIELLKALKDPDSLVRSSAIIELGSIQDREVIPDLINLLKDPDELVPPSVCQAFSQFQKDSAAEYLPQLLELIKTEFGVQALYAIEAIQLNCQYYNYEIAHFSESEIQKTENLHLSTRETTVVNYYIDQSHSTIGVGYAAENSDIKFEQIIKDITKD